MRLWDATTGDELLKVAGPVSASRLAVSPDGRHLAAAGDDGRIRIYSRDTGEVIELARERLTRALTDAECRQYLHLDACHAAE